MPFIGGMAASDPAADPAEILTPAGLAVLDQFQASCIDAPEVTAGATMLKADPATTEPWKTLLDENTPGKTAAPAPLLLIHSAQDERVPLETSAVLLARQCAAGQVVERRILPEGDHIVAAVEAYQLSFTWFGTLAAGAAPVSSCL